MANNVDPAIKYTDGEIKELDKKIKDIYSEAEADIQKKMDDFNEKFQKKDAEFQKQLKDKLITQKEYDAWKKGQVFTGKQWKLKKDEMSMVLHNSNKVATAIINKSMFGVFSENSNYMAYSMEHGAGVNFGFGLYNTDAVARLIKDDPQILPKWKVNAAKDYVWNQQNLNRAITQGIIQGESLNKISKRVSTGLSAKNENLMKTFAKTAMTEAQNAGRLERMREGKALGIDVKKKWVAVLDERTRLNHRELDGQIIDIDEPFEVGGLKIMYPGDKTAHPSMVYNCRCKLDEYFPKYPSKYNRYDNIDGVPVKGMNYNEWKKAKEKGEDIKPVPFKKPTKKVTNKLDAKHKMQSFIRDVYEYHRITNGLNAVPAKDLGDDYFEVTLTKMDDKVRDSIVNQFSDLTSRYDTPVQKIIPMGKMDYLSHKNSFATTFHNYDVDSATIMYNPVKINDVNRVKELVKNGFATQINEELADRYVITHEFAHTLIDMGSELDNSRNWLGADYKRIKGIRAEINAVYDRYVKDIGELDKLQKTAELEALTTMDEKAWANAAKLSKELRQKSIGRYALSNSDEFMAECFTHAELGGAQNDYVDEIMDIINKNFRR